MRISPTQRRTRQHPPVRADQLVAAPRRSLVAAKTTHSDVETLRARRRRASTKFQHADQAQNQMMQTLSRVLKTLQKLRTLGAASRSGL